MTESEALLAFWFGVPGGAEYGQPRQVWFVKDDAFDALLRNRYLGLWERARAGALADWEGERRSLLAFIVVCDQLPRNMFRGDPRSFATDPLALAAARSMVSRGWDLACSPVERAFVYLPFEHSEALADQDTSIAKFGELRAFPESAGYYDYAIRHRDVVARWGRFPHRNAILGRASTPEEIEFLKQPGSSF